MIRGILFDKDGTLIDFSSLWLKAAQESVPEFLRQNHLPDTGEMIRYLMMVLGVKDEWVDPKGALAHKSYRDIAKDVCKSLLNRGIDLNEQEVHRQLVDLFTEKTSGSQPAYQTFTDIRDLVSGLKEEQYLIGLATADTLKAACDCLSSLHVIDQFDYIGADDGRVMPKPHPDMFMAYQKQFGLLAEEIAVVGDTYNDIRFAKENGGIGIGVLSGVSKKEDFRGEADYIIASVAELPKLLAMINAEPSY